MDSANNETKEKIARAREALSRESREAIASVDWNSYILSLRENRKLSFSQIETLGIETEKILVGLLSGVEYKASLQQKLNLPKEEVEEIVRDMNREVFRKIKENLVEKLGNKRYVTEEKTLKPEITPSETKVFESAGINLNPDTETTKKEEEIAPKDEMLAQIENPRLIKPTTQIIAKKLTAPFQIPAVKTNFSVAPTSTPKKPIVEPVAKAPIPTVDPYREEVE